MITPKRFPFGVLKLMGFAYISSFILILVVNLSLFSPFIDSIKVLIQLIVPFITTPLILLIELHDKGLSRVDRMWDELGVNYHEDFYSRVDAPCYRLGTFDDFLHILNAAKGKYEIHFEENQLYFSIDSYKSIHFNKDYPFVSINVGKEVPYFGKLSNLLFSSKREYAKAVRFLTSNYKKIAAEKKKDRKQREREQARYERQLIAEGKIKLKNKRRQSKDYWKLSDHYLEIENTDNVEKLDALIFGDKGK